MVALEVEMAKSRVQKGKMIDRRQQGGKVSNGEPPVCSVFVWQAR